VRVTDQGGLSYDKVITLSLTNVNEAPVDVTITGTSVAENAANGTVVGTLGAVDPDAGATFTYAFVAGQDAGGRFAINGLNQIVVADGTLLNFEASASHAVTVRVTDQGGLSYDKVITLSLTNVSGSYSGGSGDDLIVGSSEEDTLEGLDGTDTLIGSLGSDYLSGGKDSGIGLGDVLIGGDGADTLDGGDGALDVADYTADTARLMIDLAVGTGSGGSAQGDLLIDIEVVLGGSGNDDLFGSGIDERLFGASGDDFLDGRGGDDLLLGGDNGDTIFGGDGNDTVSGGAGDDVLFGGTAGVDTGIDTLDYSDAAAGVAIDLTTTAAQVTGGAGTDAVSGFEVVFGSAFGDTLTGSIVTETLSGGDGGDVIQGNGGSDIIDGGAGDDLLYANDGDTIIGSDGSDSIFTSAASLEIGGTSIDGGADYDGLFLSASVGPVLELPLDLVGKVTNVEFIDATAAGAVIDLRDITGNDLRSILGLPAMGGSGTLTVDIDGDDFDVSAAAGQFTSFDSGTNTTTFFTDSSMTTEMAKVQVV
jgi:Ca2+-binding RTX toxin-like protein